MIYTTFSFKPCKNHCTEARNGALAISVLFLYGFDEHAWKNHRLSYLNRLMKENKMNMRNQVDYERRHLLKLGLMTSVVALMPTPLLAMGFPPASVERNLSFYNTHTGESLKVSYCVQGHYCPDAMADINYILRDHRTDEIKAIDPRLLDLLFAISGKVGKSLPIHIISGYRSPRTNEMLRQRSLQVAKNSLHVQGKAIDIRCPGCALTHLRQVAMKLKGGGVGYYPRSDFIHLDTGRVRYW